MKLLIFDAYGTLISTGNGSLDAAKRILKLQNKEILPEKFYADWKKYHRKNLDKANAEGFVEEAVIFQHDLEQLYKAYDINRNAKEDVQIMLDTLGKRRCFKETLSVIEQLRKNYKVVIGSTTDTKPLLQDLEINGLVVDAVYTSERIRKYKPAEAFYQYILEQEKCLVQDAVFVGDSYLDDVSGPMQIGMRAVLIDRKNTFQVEGKSFLPCRIVRNLNEIINMIEDIKA